MYRTVVFMRSCTPTGEAESSPLITAARKCHGVRQAIEANPRFAGCIIRIAENTRCAASDANPFKIRFNLQITKATVNETQWLHVINDVMNDVKLTSAVNETQWLHVIT